MNNFSKSTRLVLQILAVSIFTSTVPVQAMQPEDQPDTFFRELEALNRTEKWFEVTDQDMPHLHALVQDLSSRLGIDVPKIYVVQDDTVNALASGKKVAWDSTEYIQLSSGALTKLSDVEIEFTTAHELSHLKLKHSARIINFSLKITPILLIAISIATFFTMEINNVSDIFVPYMCVLILFVYSDKREQEKEADLLAIKTLGRSDGALSYLNKTLVECPYYERFIPNFLSTHPDPETRIKYVTAASQQ